MAVGLPQDITQPPGIHGLDIRYELRQILPNVGFGHQISEAPSFSRAERRAVAVLGYSGFHAMLGYLMPLGRIVTYVAIDFPGPLSNPCLTAA